ncbi:uncharacterized protein LOC132733152 [Ruditapes philippinarum]|uniref:uncharacterized protein LOC132733152 n=1 Tax=Ruditapes philippinarum TaxID=129788 RepID=UPI00295B40DA|nr:uncharacterized protein LOC132733152 [Ruditapes philippinarum]
MMMLYLLVVYSFFFTGYFASGALIEEQQCSRYHYEAQTLERIIKAEINLVSVQSEVTVIKKTVEQEAEERKKDHSKFANKVDMLQQEFDNFVKKVSSLQEEKILPASSSMRQFCQTNETCSDVKNSECKWMSCKCKPGMSYHHDTKTCLSDCGDYGYGNTYQVEMYALLDYFNTKTLRTISLEDCVQNCTTEKSFVCRTAEYYKTSKTCHLSWETLHTNSDKHFVNNNYVTYTRDCN